MLDLHQRSTHGSAGAKRLSSPCWQGTATLFPAGSAVAAIDFHMDFSLLQTQAFVPSPTVRCRPFLCLLGQIWLQKHVLAFTFGNREGNFSLGTSSHQPPGRTVAAHQPQGCLRAFFLCSFVLFTHFCDFKGVFREDKLLYHTFPQTRDSQGTGTTAGARRRHLQPPRGTPRPRPRCAAGGSGCGGPEPPGTEGRREENAAGAHGAAPAPVEGPHHDLRRPPLGERGGGRPEGPGGERREAGAGCPGGSLTIVSVYGVLKG